MQLRQKRKRVKTGILLVTETYPWLVSFLFASEKKYGEEETIARKVGK